MIDSELKMIRKANLIQIKILKTSPEFYRILLNELRIDLMNAQINQ